ncbi:Gfo/Idh/MocA family oxidoreductase [Pseudarthrobacter sp. NamE2]|uniref:Gfo/Idh/MocA family protein n=1 Tax=Pseudarthrobacter sp. NamE2 TaxID=2576838 RepID=UPI0010FE3640|nr:Gfo/Idh/MocA family oxidoreductase [Pseudarthrobacter sp. NamE2]TLM83577.1 Gfo/Idh/MocA family oxidoreductase [Pseudarthrobacter sp. NamE2]
MTDNINPAIRRAAIVGTGGIATAHAAALTELAGRVELAAAVDIDPARAAAFAEKWSIGRTYPDIDGLLENEDLDLVHICTPPGSHVPLAIACLRAGVTPLIEKPPALSLAEMDELAAVERETGASVLTVFQHRFGSGAIQLRNLLEKGVLGRPLVASADTLWYRDAEYFSVPWRGNWEIEGGGPTMGHGIHQFDLLLSILGEWDEVTAVAGRQSRPTDTEDVSAALVRFANGAIATVVNSVVSPRETSHLRFDFERATVELDHLYGYTNSNWTVTAAGTDATITKAWAEGIGNNTSGHTSQVAAILDALDAGTTPAVPLSAARSTMEFIAAVYASSFTGRRIKRGEIGPGDPFYTSMVGSGAPWATAEKAGVPA